MTPKERKELLEAIVGRIIDVTDWMEAELEDTDTGVLDNVPQVGKVRRYRANKKWLEE